MSEEQRSELADRKTNFHCKNCDKSIAFKGDRNAPYNERIFYRIKLYEEEEVNSFIQIHHNNKYQDGFFCSYECISSYFGRFNKKENGNE